MIQKINNFIANSDRFTTAFMVVSIVVTMAAYIVKFC